MPTYVYKFIDTGETVEVQQSFDDDTLTEAVHPESGETMAVKKVFLPVGVTFKGDGFYKTDSRASKGSSSGDGGSSSSDSSSSGTSGSGESSGSASSGSASSGSASSGSASSGSASSSPASSTTTSGSSGAASGSGSND